MKLTREQRKKIINLFPKQRGNVKVDNSRFLDAIIYICENGCKWRAFPGTFGPRHTIYVRINRRQKRRPGTDFSSAPEGTDNKQADNGGFPGFKPGQGTSRRDRSVKKRRTGSGEVPWRLEHEDTHDGGRQPVCHRVILSGGEASDAVNEAVGKVFFGLLVHYV
jgi:hypothetical protein